MINNDVSSLGTCTKDSNCLPTEVCEGGQCTDPCSSKTSCGLNAQCSVARHKKLCSCPQDFTGTIYNPNSNLTIYIGHPGINMVILLGVFSLKVATLWNITDDMIYSMHWFVKHINMTKKILAGFSVAKVFFSP